MKTTRTLMTVLAACVALSLGACTASTPATESPALAVTEKSPVTLTTAWGAQEIPADPKRVAVVSGGDRSIAYALGIGPVIEWRYPGVTAAPYITEARQRLGITDPVTFDASDGTDFAAIAEADPDVILAMNSYSMDDDFKQLAKIAPVITFEKTDQALSMTWQDRLLRAALGLGLTEKAEQVIAANQQVVTDAKAAHPELAGKTYTYLVVHPEQISYMSHAQADPSPLDDLGLVKSANAAKFTGDNNKLSLENLDLADADVLLIAYPFGDEGLLSRSELEKKPLWTKIPAVAAGRWAIIDSDSGLASDIAYPDALSYPWVVQQLTPVLVKALAGEGPA
ncbi:ABC transporter substrate-binding protein [Micropruina sp.]|uniref:ABC transporter substrate-binding protein n=1 Tax=Micropruina sp. TaxID=2737536 RepID=UPI0039E5C4DB